MLVKISKHIQNLAKKSEPIKRQFYPSEREKEWSKRASLDPLSEEKYKKVKGLIYKYPRRVLIELTLNCASFCRFCTRRRKVSDIKKGKLSLQDIKKMISYIHSQLEINEVIISGGDPLMAPKLLIFIMKALLKLTQIKIIRIHTRVPVSDPHFLTKELLNIFSEVSDQKTLYIGSHFEHPDEITPLTVKAVRSLRKTGAILLSQSVFLKGINDSYKVLKQLFTRLSELGVKPYYIFHCDLVRGVEHFIVPIEKEIKIMTKLRKKLSGIAFPFHAIDAPDGFGKIIVPLDFWKFEKGFFRDFHMKKIKMYPPLRQSDDNS